jgi:hypothetical protein
MWTMISAWWIPFAFIAGGMLGVIAMALLQFAGALPERRIDPRRIDPQSVHPFESTHPLC